MSAQIATEDVGPGQEILDPNDDTWKTVAAVDTYGVTAEPWSDETTRLAVPATRIIFEDGTSIDWPDCEPVNVR